MHWGWTPAAFVLWPQLCNKAAPADLDQLGSNRGHWIDDIMQFGPNGQEVPSAQEVLVRRARLRGCELRLTKIQGSTTSVE